MLETEDLLKEFYVTNKEELLKDLSYAQTKEICFGPWEFLKKVFESSELPVVRFKYFGKFIARPKKIKSILAKNKIQLSKGLITEVRYQHVKNMVETYLEKYYEKE